ncbi:MAG TPA: sigma-70 family RNA polymerase sigma factor, partial [Isosphaeraceae bacterium]|nr:sigma-70 family RNA polymerase sigma factor [Isosphaeraceae bacterium]
EDAFQATFLVLVKKAATLRNGDLLTNWLYGVALRVAQKEKARGARRRVVERRAAERTLRPAGDGDPLELGSVIDEEIRRLPERYRLPLVLCHLEGLRHDEVARRLGCPVGTVESRLSRARQQLRSRLSRRGLAPTGSALGAVLRPPAVGLVQPSLVDATLQAAFHPSAEPGRIVTLSAGSLWEWIGRFIPTPIAGVGALGSALVIAVGLVAIGPGRLRTDGPVQRPTPPPPAAAADPPAEAPRPAASRRSDPPSPRPRRSPFAIARPISGITIDGRLDDWPQGLERHPIDHQLTGIDGYNSEPRGENPDPQAFFLVGYDRQAEWIYLAAVVRDADLVVHPSNVRRTDALEVYLDGTFGEDKIEPIEEPSGDWRRSLDAATMPVHQYVAVPGPVPAYGDPWGANPSLVYGRTRERRTQMKYRRQGQVTTYEWAIQPYDRFPERPTRLVPGKRLGLEVVVVDKDSDKVPPVWMYWGPLYRGFKGCDAGSLGELILAEDP